MIEITKSAAQVREEKDRLIKEEIEFRTCPECGTKASDFNSRSGPHKEHISLFKSRYYSLIRETCPNEDCLCEWQWKKYKGGS